MGADPGTLPLSHTISCPPPQRPEPPSSNGVHSHLLLGSQSEVHGESLDAVQANVPLLQVRTEREGIIKLTWRVRCLLKGGERKPSLCPGLPSWHQQAWSLHTLLKHHQNQSIPWFHVASCASAGVSLVLRKVSICLKAVTKARTEAGLGEVQPARPQRQPGTLSQQKLEGPGEEEWGSTGGVPPEWPVSGE